VSFATAF